MPEIILYFRDAARRVCQWYIFTSHMDIAAAAILIIIVRKNNVRDIGGYGD